MVLSIGVLAGGRPRGVTAIFRTIGEDSADKDFEAARVDLIEILRKYAIEQLGYMPADEGDKFEILVTLT